MKEEEEGRKADNRQNRSLRARYTNSVGVSRNFVGRNKRLLQRNSFIRCIGYISRQSGNMHALSEEIEVKTIRRKRDGEELKRRSEAVPTLLTRSLNAGMVHYPD